jgi:hypothetical protein
MNQDEITIVAQKLLESEFIFDRSQQGLLPLKIQRNIGPNECVDILPTLEKIYRLTMSGKVKKSADLISELAGLLVAADLGIAKQFLIELEVKKVLPKALNVLRQDLIEDSQKLGNSIDKGLGK